MVEEKRMMYICSRRDECEESGCFHYHPHEWSVEQACDSSECMDLDGWIECVPVEETGESDG